MTRRYIDFSVDEFDEDLDELSQNTLGSYIKKAASDRLRNPDKASKRATGVRRAFQKGSAKNKNVDLHPRIPPYEGRGVREEELREADELTAAGVRGIRADMYRPGFAGSQEWTAPGKRNRDATSTRKPLDPETLFDTSKYDMRKKPDHNSYRSALKHEREVSATRQMEHCLTSINNVAVAHRASVQVLRYLGTSGFVFCLELRSPDPTNQYPGTLSPSVEDLRSSMNNALMANPHTSNCQVDLLDSQYQIGSSDRTTIYFRLQLGTFNSGSSFPT